MTQTRTVELDITEDGRYRLKSSPLDKDNCKLVPGAKWNPETATWDAPLSWAATKAIRGIFGDRLAVTEAVIKKATEMYTEIVMPAYEARNAMDTNSPTVLELRGTTKFTLRHFQEAGSAYLRMVERGCLFDPMGTGKTAQVISALRLLPQELTFPALVVCPNSVKSSWVREVALWAPHLRIIDFGNTAKARAAAIKAMKAGEADIMVVNWESLSKNSSLASFGAHKPTRGEKTPGPLNEIAWQTVIADEAHRGKNPAAKQTRALWALAHSKSVNFRYGMTGTPMANSPIDLWSIFHFVRPDEFPSRSRFMDRYCLLGFGDWGGVQVLGLKPETRDEFDEISSYLWRRTPKEIALPELPPKVPVLRECEMTTAQKKQYDAMRDTMVVEMQEEESAVVAVNAISRLTRLLQFASATATLSSDNEVLLKDPSCKIDELEDILDELEPSEQVVVFAVSRKLIELAAARLDKKGISYGMITGKVSNDERTNNVNKFQDKKLRVMLSTIAAGGVGITLTAANTMVFLQRSFSAIDNSQAEDRCHRIGSEVHESITIIDVVSKGTLDEHVLDIAGMKKEALQDLVRDGARLAALIKNGTLEEAA
ncbi:MAG TPA: DEAD/DEAH box helicase [Rhodoglobus sp.]|nr:DEAD/DEAH box helicase [Rhodoglobus sp.]